MSTAVRSKLQTVVWKCSPTKYTDTCVGVLIKIYLLEKGKVKNQGTFEEIIKEEENFSSTTKNLENDK